jgi:hypothetical protein
MAVTFVRFTPGEEPTYSIAVFIKLWSADHQWSAAVRQVVRGGPQTISEETALPKFYQTLNECKIHANMSVLKLPLFFDQRN